MKRARQQLRRLYWIDAALQREPGPNAAGLARELGVSRDTIYRDLQALRTEYRAPLRFDPTEGAYSYARPFRPNLPALPAEEALGLARNLVKQGEIRESALAECLHRFTEQFADLFPGDLPAAATRLASAPQEGASDQAAAARPAAGTPSPEASLPLPLGKSLRRYHPPIQDGRGRRGGRKKPARESTTVLLRFDRSVAREVLGSGLFERREMQLLTDGGLEARIVVTDPDTLLLDLLHWAPNFEVAHPPWVRRRLPQLLRRLVRQLDARARRTPSKRSTKRSARASSHDGPKKSPAKTASKKRST